MTNQQNINSDIEINEQLFILEFQGHIFFSQ